MGGIELSVSPRIRPDVPEPVLILTDEDYRRAFVPEVEPRAAASPEPFPEDRPAPQRKIVRRLLLAACLLLGIAGATIAGIHSFKTDPPTPIAKAIAPKPAPVLVAPPPAPEPPPRPVLRAALPPPPEPDVDEPPPPPAPAPAKAERVPWLGDRAWIVLRLRIERAGQARESDHRVTVAWDGRRFVLERPNSEARELWRDRLELLFQLPVEDESWRRQVTRTSTETIHVRSGDLACKVVEGEDRFPQGVRKFRYSYSDEFPAGAIEARQTLGDFTVSCRVLDFGAASANKP